MSFIQRPPHSTDLMSGCGAREHLHLLTSFIKMLTGTSLNPVQNWKSFSSKSGIHVLE